MTESFYVDYTVTVKVDITDPGVYLRVIENHDYEGVPQPDEKGGRGWRNVYYGLKDMDEVIEMLAYNCVANGVEDARRLDGWADLDPGKGIMRIVDTRMEGIDPA